MRPMALLLHAARQRLRCRFGPGSLVLMYHRVAEVGPDPWGLCVTPTNFRNHLKVLRAKRVRLLGMQDLVKALVAGKIPPRSVAITFDDGYADNYHFASPLLTDYEIPATIFVTAGQVEAAEEFWWDALERIFLHAGELPSVLDLVVRSQPRRWELGRSASFSISEAERWQHWRADESAPTVRHQLYKQIWQVLFDANSEERNRLVRELTLWAGLPLKARATHRSMTEEELQHLAGGVVEVGAHTWTHPSLAKLSTLDQADELRRSKSHLEQILGRMVKGCSYPHGHYSPQTFQLVQKLGYSYACGSTQIPVRSDAERFHLPRVAVDNWSLPAFERFVARYLPI
jgi:peptidoglycan/xylan/chitin deacetylase (PgdA/CDA1 family)